MFIEDRELPVTAPAKVGIYHELAEAMRRGMKIVSPASSYGSADPTIGCALCCLATGLKEPVGPALWHHRRDIGKTWRKLTKKYGVTLIREIEARFEGFGDFEPHTFVEIADWLCREGGCEHAL